MSHVTEHVMPDNCILLNCYSCFISGQRNTLGYPPSSAYMSLLLPQLAVIDRRHQVCHSLPPRKQDQFFPFGSQPWISVHSFIHFQQTIYLYQDFIGSGACSREAYTLDGAQHQTYIYLHLGAI